mgnify:CR=1 FL=1
MWPAVVGLIGFFWAELLWPGGSVPLNLALAITLYGLVTLDWNGPLWLRDLVTKWRSVLGDVWSICKVRAVGSAGEIACRRAALPGASLSIPKWGLCQRICLCLSCKSRSDRMELKAAGRRIIARPKGSGIHDGFCVGSLGIRHLRWIS